jgi:Ataxin-3
MAGLERLASIIYHEKQQPGSMLCAQHALNSLLRMFICFGRCFRFIDSLRSTEGNYVSFYTQRPHSKGQLEI